MRSSKSRSRNKSNRNRSPLGNVVNRVFDSSGPEGKVRGTPQQIIDKYNQLARDTQLAGDRVLTENFQQHAEHYLRLLGSAQKEQDQKREEQERQNRERQAERDRERAQRQERESNGESDTGNDASTDSLQSDSFGDSGLVETPESQSDDKPQKPKRARKPRKKPDSGNEGGGGEQGDKGGSEPSAAAE
ncbi:hypothetical protein FIU85_02790 [Roseovarius sp. THAF8]|uniref:DUF4167 domain-containing protein n=1 Tax=Roseovarius sp. THAF8 TaxID=2587846 RepID=UPI0012687F55|nr:DUF4167 domain-containing protein [Roseovarius sp. THAF8]QFT96221.1 hypothetical protein FIU85_02790 [Roseovarius sp. THAF8]